MSTQRQDRDRYVALSGGVGGAKLSLGLANLLGERLTVIVNTGDDFELLGLYISPISTLSSTPWPASPTSRPAGAARRDLDLRRCWRLGGPGWFKLGDRDLATHIVRTRRCAQARR